MSRRGAHIRSLANLGSRDTVPFSRLLVLSSPKIRRPCIYVFHHNLSPGLTLKPVDYTVDLGGHLVRVFSGCPQLRLLPPGLGRALLPDLVSFRETSGFG